MSMPVFNIDAETVAEAWEKTVRQVWSLGIRKLTEYQRGGRPINQESKAATVLIRVKRPLREPRIHAGDVMGQQAIISGYIDEIIEGVKDYYVEEGNWEYTYHERLTKYKVPTLKPINQLDRLVEELKRGNLFSRRLQAVTWQVWKDQESKSPPCFQRLWVTVPTLDLKPKHGKRYKVEFQTCWRSRDLFDAWGANVNAIIELCHVKIVEKLNRIFKSADLKFEVGQYVDFSNDLHIYEKDFKEVEMFISTLDKKRAMGRSLNQIRQGATLQTLIGLGRSKRRQE